MDGHALTLPALSRNDAVFRRYLWARHINSDGSPKGRAFAFDPKDEEIPVSNCSVDSKAKATQAKALAKGGVLTPHTGGCWGLLQIGCAQIEDCQEEIRAVEAPIKADADHCAIVHKSKVDIDDQTAIRQRLGKLARIIASAPQCTHES